MSDFKAFIETQIHRYGTAERLAHAIGMTPSAFSRGVRNEGTLSTENCLRLAEETGETATRVLRLAGKGDVAELIERLYGRAKTPLSGGDREILGLWANLSQEADSAFRVLLRALTGSHHHNNSHRHVTKHTA